MPDQITLPTLYPDQQKLVRKTLEAIRRSGNVVICGITGSGKSRIAKWILGSVVVKPRRPDLSGNLLICVHRRSLVDNLIDCFNQEPRLPHGVIMSNRDTDNTEPIQIASIDTLLSWYCEEGQYRSSWTYDIAIFDECHASFSQYRKFLEAHDKIRKAQGKRKTISIGLSATPESPGLGEIYREIVYGESAVEMQRLGRASPYEYYHGVRISTENLVVNSGEYTKKSVEEAIDGQLIGRMVRDWKKLAQGRPTISFFRSRSQAQFGRDQYEANGIRARFVDCTTADKTRHHLYETLGQEYDVLCNVKITERGTDIPCCSAIQLCLPIYSTKTYYQMIGRGSRRHPTKQNCRIIDHGGNVLRHGLFEDHVDWKLLKDKVKLPVHKARVVAECPQCGVLYRGGECSACGYKPSVPELRSQDLEFVDGEMQRVIREPVRRAYTDRLVRSWLFKGGHTGMPLHKAVGMAVAQAKREGQDFDWSGIRCVRLPQQGSPDWRKQVCHIFPWTARNYRR